MTEHTKEQAMFGAGCFWSVEANFRQIEGVLETAVGYSGGDIENPTYEDVCTGITDHAEVVHLYFDPNTVSYTTLLKAFWKMHDPTTLNRQGPDVGTQYRSAVFFFDKTQEAEALALKNSLNTSNPSTPPMITEITPASTFYRGESYHQCYLEKNKSF